MKTPEEAERLARCMVSIGDMAGRKTYAVITDMNEPLGNTVGNALEVQEAIAVLQGKGEARLTEVTMELASYMLIGGGGAATPEEAKRMLRETIDNGTALDKLAEWVNAQGGNPQWIYHPECFPKAKWEEAVYPAETGYLTACRTSEVGMASYLLGGGRQKKGDTIDPTVGIRLLKHLGDAVSADEPFAYLYGNDRQKLEEAKQRFIQAYTITQRPMRPSPVIQTVIAPQ